MEIKIEDLVKAAAFCLDISFVINIEVSLALFKWMLITEILIEEAPFKIIKILLLLVDIFFTFENQNFYFLKNSIFAILLVLNRAVFFVILS